MEATKVKTYFKRIGDVTGTTARYFIMTFFYDYIIV